MGTPLILTFDIGTQSARAVLVRPDGAFEDILQINYEKPYISEKLGFAEVRPDFYFDIICKSGKMLCERNKDKLNDITAVVLAAVRDSVLCLDKDNKPLRNILLWLDNRQAVFDKPYSFIIRLAFKLVGMDYTTKTIYRAAHCNWIMQNEPDIWEKTAKFVMLPTYLNYKLTGKLCDSKANMIGHVPFDYKKRRWRSKFDIKRCLFDIPNEKLCETVDSGEELGRITKQI